MKGGAAKPDGGPTASPTLGKQPSEYVGYVLLGYLVQWRQDHGADQGCTPFHLAHRVPGLKTQRQARVQEILALFETKKFVRATVADRVTIYVATDEGVKWYTETATRFYSVFERLYKKPDSL